ncbi:hypothetical protein [Halobacillus sp. Marseille-Q1614]|nr:hypothetical protein [Halobacillus sp. Marseille-Q1614]
MGYILPVSQFQYQDYQQRITPDSRSSFCLERIYPVTLREFFLI